MLFAVWIDVPWGWYIPQTWDKRDYLFYTGGAISTEVACDKEIRLDKKDMWHVYMIISHKIMVMIKHSRCKKNDGLSNSHLFYRSDE